MSFRLEPFEQDGMHAYWYAAYEDRTPDQAFLDFIWELTDGFACYAIPRYHRDAGVSACGEPYALVDWEYEVDLEQDNDPACDAIRGFVPARSGVTRPVIPGVAFDLFNPVLGAPSPYAAATADKAGLFKVHRREALTNVYTGLLGDASAELNLFALQEDLRVGPERLLEALSQREPPRLADALGPDDRFVDLVRGVDMGYSSALLIQSRADLSEKLGIHG